MQKWCPYLQNVISFMGVCTSLTPTHGFCPWTTLRALLSDSQYWFALRARHRVPASDYPESVQLTLGVILGPDISYLNWNLHCIALFRVAGVRRRAASVHRNARSDGEHRRWLLADDLAGTGTGDRHDYQTHRTKSGKFQLGNGWEKTRGW